MGIDKIIVTLLGIGAIGFIGWFFLMRPGSFGPERIISHEHH